MYTHHMEEYPMFLNSSHIFDENLSVKRNREMVVEHNRTVDNMLREHKEKDRELGLQLRKDVTEYIANTYNMSNNQAGIVESYVYNEYHAFVSDYLNSVDDVANMVEKVLNAKEV